MKATIEVSTKQEGAAIKTALEDPVVKAFAVVVGILKSLPSDKARARVLAYVKDSLEDGEIKE